MVRFVRPASRLANRRSFAPALLLATLVLLIHPRSALARPEYAQQLPESLKTNCAVCHQSKAGGGPLNNFGTAFAMADRNLDAIRDEDSDGDGYTTGQELEAGTNPGDPGDFPGAKNKGGPSINAQIGNNALLAAFLVILFAFLIGAFGAGLKDPRLIEASRRALIASTLLTTLSTAMLLRGFFTNDFQIEYVQHHSNVSMPWYYKFTGLWGGQEGSLLLWLFVLGLYSAYLAHSTGKHVKALAAPNPGGETSGDPAAALFYGYVYTVLAAILAFFGAVLLFITPPFRLLESAPKDGAGLNALLQNPFMLIHPPMLYLGYIGMSVPYAFALAALLSGRTDAWWLRRMRGWAMVAWTFLTVGVILGGAWAYVVLSFGGYWAWDPVENASFLPWLASTAYIHSQMISERRDMMKIWNLTLVALAFWLSILGTFITRSGIINSVHAFAVTAGLGAALMAFLIAIIVVTALLLYYRWHDLQSTEKIESPVSREGAFLLNNWVFLGLTFTVLWGTMYPILSGWASLLMTGQEKKGEVGALFYNQLTVPLFLILLFLTGVGPHISWRKATVENLRRGFYWPSWIWLGVMVLVGALGFRHWVQPLKDAFTMFSAKGALGGFAALGSFAVGYWLPYFAYGLTAFLLAMMAEEFLRGIKARKRMKGDPPLKALKTLILKNRRRYGGFIVHIGIGIIAIGVTASTAFKVQKDFTLSPGQVFDFYGMNFTFKQLEEVRGPGYTEVRALFDLKEGNHTRELHPSKRQFDGAGTQAAEQASISTSVLGDLYIILAGWTEEPAAAGAADPPYTVSVRFSYHPLVGWIWFGGFVMLAGALVALTFRYLKDKDE